MTKPMIVALFLFGVLGCASRQPTQAAADDPHADARSAFVRARAAVATVPTEPVGGDPPELRQYPLYPYLVSARLARQLELALPAATIVGTAALPIDDAIAAFLAQENERPVTVKLRLQWLESLAERRLWSRFMDEYSPARDTPVGLQCRSFAARIAMDRTAGLSQAISETWLSSKSLPDACDAAFDWWLASGGRTPEMVTRRARLALEAGETGLARSLAQTLPHEQAAPLLQWAALIQRPGPEVTALLAAPHRVVEEAALRDGWVRYARSDPEDAAAAFPQLVAARKLDARAASPYALAVALALSWSRLPPALDFFGRVHADDFDEAAHEWHVRAALWAGNWPRVAQATAAMPEALRNQPRWRYWSARAAEQLGSREAAREAYAAVLPTDNWYAVHAASRLGVRFTPSLQSLPLDDVEITLIGSEPAFVRARELRLAQMEPEATAEWRAAFDTLPAAQQLQAIGLAARWGWHMQAIAAAARQRLFNDYEVLYPRPFDFDVRTAARRTGLDSELIYAIIRQESLYETTAASSAGALGLMQLLPETARITARRAGLPAPTRSQLLQPAVNVPLGSHFLASLLERFDGEMALATAGYNAGPNAVRRWLPIAPMDRDVWVENIPYNETRGYVQRVAWHSLVFRWLEDRKPRDVSGWQARKINGATEVTRTAANR
jgi:soluble lytic murein transglycosylase